MDDGVASGDVHSDTAFALEMAQLFIGDGGVIGGDFFEHLLEFSEKENDFCKLLIAPATSMVATLSTSNCGRSKKCSVRIPHLPTVVLTTTTAT